MTADSQYRPLNSLDINRSLHLHPDDDGIVLETSTRRKICDIAHLTSTQILTPVMAEARILKVCASHRLRWYRRRSIENRLESDVPLPQTFESFLQMPSRALAYRKCRSLAEDSTAPGVLLLHGGPGTGKTHLLRAVAHAARRRRWSCRVEETRTADLVTNVVRKLTSQPTTAASRGRYDDVDLLIVDDLQWLVAKTATQRYVAELFRRTVDAGASVVCASGVAPRALPELSDVLAAEPSYQPVAMGPVPQRELHRTIRYLADLHGVPLSASTVRLLAERCGGDVGRIHGLVAQFTAAVQWPTSEARAAEREDARGRPATYTHPHRLRGRWRIANPRQFELGARAHARKPSIESVVSGNALRTALSSVTRGTDSSFESATNSAS